MNLRISMAVLVIALSGCADFSTIPSMDINYADIGHDGMQQDLANKDSTADPGYNPDVAMDIYKDGVQPQDNGNDYVKNDITEDTAKDIIYDTHKDVYKDVTYDVYDVDIVSDIAKDTGPKDIVNDMYKDIYQDIDGVEDVYPGPIYKMFRLTSLNVEEPGFLYCQGMGTCTDITSVVNNLINQYIDGQLGDQPLDILVKFGHNPGGYDTTIGNGACVRQGNNVVGCDFVNGGDQVTYQDVMFKGPQFSSLCMNNPQVIPTCFSTDSQDASIAIPGMNMVLGLRDAWIAAHFTEDSPFDNADMQGYLLGFMPFQWAHAISISYPGYFQGTMDQLLPKDKITVYNGEKGWWFTFSFDATPVPPSPYSF